MTSLLRIFMPSLIAREKRGGAAVILPGYIIWTVWQGYVMALSTNAPGTIGRRGYPPCLYLFLNMSRVSIGKVVIDVKS